MRSTMYIKPLFILSIFVLNSEQLKLQKVLILSRHNIRTPLSKTLSQFSAKSWPRWREKPGFLTAKGRLLEGYMGTYFSEWLRKEKLLQLDCPEENDLFVYANNFQRTVATAKAFVDSAFPSCNIDVHTNGNRIDVNDDRKLDPVFNPIIHNQSTEFTEKVAREMRKDIQHLQLTEEFKQLEEILDYKHSRNCIKDHKCSLVCGINRPIVEAGSQPVICGPLNIGKSVIDAFIIAYYEGLDMEHVAWGELRTEEKWSSILDIYHTYQSVLFNSTSKDISRPLIKYIKKSFNSDIKVTVLVGHDSNIYTVLNSIGNRPYKLEKQKEVTPIGGKVVFQKWSDDYLKIDYVYQYSKDMRDGKQLSLLAPPMIQELELKDCEKQENGLYLWSDFEKVLEKLTI